MFKKVHPSPEKIGTNRAWLHSHVTSLRILVSWSTNESKMEDESAEVDERSEITPSGAQKRMGTEG